MVEVFTIAVHSSSGHSITDIKSPSSGHSITDIKSPSSGHSITDIKSPLDGMRALSHVVCLEVWLVYCSVCHVFH